MDENFKNWDTPAPLPDMEAELKRIRKDIRKRNWKIILTSLVLVAALLFGTVNYGIPALEGLYWDPNTTSYGTSATDLEMTFYAYSTLFNNSRVTLGVTAARTGFATYSLSLESLSWKENERSFGHATLEKGTLTIQEGFWDDWRQYYVGNTFPETQEHYIELLSQLPDYIRVGCYVTFREDITMEEALTLHTDWVQDIADTDNFTQMQWIAIRHEDNAYARPCGLTLDGVEGFFDEVDAWYPYFSSPYHDASGNPIGLDAKVYEERFKSLLRYLRDQQEKGEGIEVPNYPNYYADALSYVEENGVKVYGCYITASAKRLLEINEMDNVKYLWPVAAWINI